MIKLKFVKLPSVCCGLDRNNKKVFTSLNCLISAQQSMDKFKEFNDPPGLVLAFVAKFCIPNKRTYRQIAVCANLMTTRGPGPDGKKSACKIFDLLKLIIIPFSLQVR